MIDIYRSLKLLRYQVSIIVELTKRKLRRRCLFASVACLPDFDLKE